MKIKDLFEGQIHSTRRYSSQFCLHGEIGLVRHGVVAAGRTNEAGLNRIYRLNPEGSLLGVVPLTTEFVPFGTATVEILPAHVLRGPDGRYRPELVENILAELLTDLRAMTETLLMMSDHQQRAADRVRWCLQTLNESCIDSGLESGDAYHYFSSGRDGRAYRGCLTLLAEWTGLSLESASRALKVVRNERV